MIWEIKSKKKSEKYKYRSILYEKRARRCKQAYSSRFGKTWIYDFCEIL